MFSEFLSFFKEKDIVESSNDLYNNFLIFILRKRVDSNGKRNTEVKVNIICSYNGDYNLWI